MKVLCQLRGREVEYKGKAVELFHRLADDCDDLGKIEQEPKSQGKSVIMYLIPKK